MNEIEAKTSWSKGADQTTIDQTLLQKATGRTWYTAFMTNTGSTSGNGNLILSKYPRHCAQSAAHEPLRGRRDDLWRRASRRRPATASPNGAHRIDYIFQSKKATYLTLVSMQIFNTADAHGVKPSDHNPVLAVFHVR